MAVRRAAGGSAQRARDRQEDQSTEGVANKPQAQPEALMRNRRQAIPEYARASILEPLRSRLPLETRDWEKTLRADPCAYCNEPASEVDHIRPRVAGGSDSWQNTTGACHECNQNKAAIRLLQFLSGRSVPLRLVEPRLERLDGSLVATADLRQTPYDSGGNRNRSSRLLTALLAARPEADGAVLYGRRGRNDRHHGVTWVHILRMRPGTADAATICRHGGGTRDYGAFVTRRPLFDGRRQAARETQEPTPRAGRSDLQAIYEKTRRERVENNAMRAELPGNVQNAINEIRRVIAHERMRELRIRTTDHRTEHMELYASAYLDGNRENAGHGAPPTDPGIAETTPQPVARGIRMIRKSLARNGFEDVVISTYDSGNGGTQLEVNAKSPDRPPARPPAVKNARRKNRQDRRGWR